jgi:DNA-binding MarR family transcriptional regulator
MYMAVMAAEQYEMVVTAWVRLARGYTRILAMVEDELKARNLPELAWYDVLIELKRAHPEKLRPKDLQARLLLPQHGMSRLLDRMDAEKLVRREPCAEDRRGQLVSITTAGQEMVRRMWPVYRNGLRQALGQKLSERELDQVATILQKVERR